MTEALSAAERRLVKAEADVDAAIAALVAARERRDRCVVVVASEGAKPTRIARLTGMSVSNVRRVTDIAKWRATAP